jgi:membrane-bound ClpP family serine protease
MMKNISSRVYIRYALFQLPGTVILISIMLLLQYYIGFDWSVFWIILVAWVIKDILMFPFIWRSYDQSSSGTMVDMKGKEAIVTRKLDPEGYVRVGRELWYAILDDGENAEKGEEVSVVNRNGLKLIVQKKR